MSSIQPTLTRNRQPEVPFLENRDWYALQTRARLERRICQQVQDKQQEAYWNCWNSIAVMFELRCSKFEFDCSESVGNRLVRDQGVGVSNPLSPTNYFINLSVFLVR